MAAKNTLAAMYQTSTEANERSFPGQQLGSIASLGNALGGAREPHIRRAMGALNKQIAETEAICGELAKKLQPALSESIPSPNKEPECLPPQSNVPMASMTDEFNSRIQRINRTLTDLAQRCEL